MPTYEYKCDACGNAFEKFQPITSAPVRKCPKCGKNKVRRLISAGGGMIFKGSGFYITDYRDAGYKEKAKADSGTASDAAANKGEGKTETKPDAKPAAAETATPTASAAPVKNEAKSESKSDKGEKRAKSSKKE